MTEIASAYVSLLPSAKGFGSSLEGQVSGEVKKSGAKMGGFLGGALKKGALGVAAGAGTVIGTALFSGFKRLNAIDQAQAKLRGLGNSAKQVDGIMNNALASVKGTAFGLDEAATTAGSVVAAGVKPGRQLTNVLKTVADTATIAGTSMGDMGQIFGSVAARGKLQGDDLMQLQSRGVPVLAFLAKQYGVTAKAASKMVSEGKVDFKNFTAAMKKGLGGAALKSGQTVSGSFDNMKAALGRLGAALLGTSFDKLPQTFTKITDALDGMQGSAEAVGKALAGMFQWIAKNGAVVATFAAGLAAAGVAMKAVQLYSKAVAISEAAQAVAAGTATEAQIALNAAMKANLIGVVVVAIAALAAGLVYAYKHSKTFRNIVQGAFAGVKAAASAMWKFLKPILGFFVGQLADIGGKAKWLWNNAISPAFSAIGKGAKAMWHTLKAAFNWIVGGFLAMAGAILHGADKMFGWIPKVGPKLHSAVAQFDAFRDSVNRSLAGIHDKTITIRAVVKGARAGAAAAAAAGAGTSGRRTTTTPTAPLLPRMGRHRRQSLYAALLANFIEGSRDSKGKLTKAARRTARNLAKQIAKGFRSSKDSTIGKALSKLVDNIKLLPKSMRGAVKKMARSAEQMIAKVDKMRSKLKQVAASVRDAFRPSDLFGGTIGDLSSGLSQGLANIKAVMAALPTLSKKGLKNGFLNQLMASGNTGLILTLASSDAATVRQYQRQYNQIQKLSSGLGNSVARRDQTAKSIDRLGDRLDQKLEQIRKELSTGPERTGRSVGGYVNRAAAEGHRRKRAAA